MVMEDEGLMRFHQHEEGSRFLCQCQAMFTPVPDSFSRCHKKLSGTGVNLTLDVYLVAIYKSDEKREDWMITEASGDSWVNHPCLDLTPIFSQPKNTEITTR